MNTTYYREAWFAHLCGEDGHPMTAVTKLVQSADGLTVMILHQHMDWDDEVVKDEQDNDTVEEAHDMFFASFIDLQRQDDMFCVYVEGERPDDAGFKRRMRERMLRELVGHGMPEGLIDALRGLVPEQREAPDNVVPIGTGYGMYL